MTVRRPASIAALGVIVLCSMVTVTADQSPALREAGARLGLHFRGLAPGEFVVHKQQVPVDIVLIGFGQNQVNVSDLRGVLPATYAPIVRYPQFYGLNGRDMGLEYRFRYSVTRASRSLEDQFFRHLQRIGTPIAPTAYQLGYNAQATNVLDVTGPVLDINAERVEQWLESNAKPRRNAYTVYFVNWYGRQDFRFHVFTKKDDPDPDTGFAFGGLASRTISSWGGTSGRTWFYDFSAGPEYNTTNWYVDDTDLDGDGEEEYRMPPIWEYAANGYRSPTELGFDMGLLTRFVAIDLLFTTSPLYDPLVASPEPLGRRVVDMTVLEDDPATVGANFLNAGFAEGQWRDFQPYYRWKTAKRSVNPIDPGAKKALEIFSGNSDEEDCWVPFGDPFAQLFCYFSENLGLYVPQYPARDYVAPVFAYNTTQAGLGDEVGLLGFADDNWVDGTQSMVFAFNGQFYRNAGYGFTGTIVHEVGHHIGMSHPHDGYDAEFGLDFGPGGSLFFAWEGDESDTVMQYLGMTNRFGEHNRDNMYRWETAGYLNWANALAGDIMASGKAHRIGLLLIAADVLAARAQSKFDDWDYLEAVADARAAYGILVEAADAIGVSSSTLAMARRALPESQIQKYVCRPRDLIERMQLR